MGEEVERRDLLLSFCKAISVPRSSPRIPNALIRPAPSVWHVHNGLGMDTDWCHSVVALTNGMRQLDSVTSSFDES